MRGFTRIASAVFFVTSIFACGLPADADEPAQQVASSKGAMIIVPTMPAIPAEAVDFASAYPEGTPLYTTKNASAYTVIFRDPYNDEFFAYGFDPANFVTVFFVKGPLSDLARLQAQHHTDVVHINAVLERGGLTHIGDGMAGQYIPPPPRNPPQGKLNSYAWTLSNGSYKLNAGF